MSHALDALTKPQAKEAIFAGLDVLMATGNQQEALDATIRKGAENGAAAEFLGGAFADVAGTIIRLIDEYEKSQKTSNKK